MFLLRKSFGYRKIVFLGYKHIRLKSSECFPSINEINCKDLIKCRITKLSEILDCTYYTAKKIVSHNLNIISITSDTFLRNSEFCRKYLKLSDVVEFPIIISYNPSLLQHRYFSLMELGCSNVTVTNIIKFSQILKKSPSALEKEGIIFNIDNFLEDYLCMIECENKNKVEYCLHKMYKNRSSLGDIKAAMNAEFLSSKLNCSLVVAHQMLKKYPPLRTQSILNTSLMLDVLLKDFKLPSSKVFSVSSLLSLHHEIAQQFLIDIPSILGKNTIELFSKFPLILRRPIYCVQKIENILKDYNISGDQLMHCPKIMNFSPSTIQNRLENLCSSEDFSLLKSYKTFLWLVYYYNNLELRSLALKKRDISCSIGMFTSSEARFHQYLSTRLSRSNTQEIYFYLASILDCGEDKIQMILKEYPNILNSSLKNCKQIVEFLLVADVSKEQILNGVGVIFYDFEVVKMVFYEMQKHSDCQPFTEWINHYNLIQLLIYKVEVKAGFRGTILYKVKENLNDCDEPSVEIASS